MRLTRLLIASVLSLSSLALVAVQNAEPATATTSIKRGAASVKYIKYKDSLPGKLTGAGADWTYNWNYLVPPSSSNLELVPMLRKAGSVTSDAVRILREGQQAGSYRYLLGFNEPDGRNQANMTATQAANLWPQLQSTGLLLGSPAPANPTNGWLKSFMDIAKARQLRVDFIALHFYANIIDTNALHRIKTQVEAVRAHYGKPIWVTEIGIIDRRTSPGTAAANWIRAVKFMRSVTAMLDAKPYVQRYAWMADNVSGIYNLRWSSLYDASGRLTPLGTAYSRLS